MISWVLLQTASNFWLTYWSSVNDPSNSFYYLEIYTILNLSYPFFSVFRTIQLYCRSIRCSRTIHKAMFQSVLRAPINSFFDRVPVGRLLNRFSKDLTMVDTYLTLSYNMLLNNIYGLLADVFVCFYV